MHILMYGWEYPPKYNGGLGIACQGLVRALSAQDHEVTFILPKIEEETKDAHTHLIDVSKISEESIVTTREEFDVTYHEIGSKLMPYLSIRDFQKSARGKAQTKPNPEKSSETSATEISLLKQIQLTGEYNKDLMAEMTKYAVMSTTVLQDSKFDIIHAHDWMSFKAALIAKKMLSIPLVIHIHSTEWDRNGAFVNPEVEKIEKEGFEKCDHIIAVSNRVKQQLIDHYEVPEKKITIIPNGIEPGSFANATPRKSTTRTVGFLGRLVDQKGPQKFIDIARDLCSKMDNVKFKLAGQGYLEADLNHKIDRLNMKDKVEMLGFLERDKVRSMLQNLDLLIVPSISEPFGLVALEGVASKVPVIVSSEAGILEYLDLKHAAHWNIHEFSNLAYQVLNDPAGTREYVKSCTQQMKKLDWNKLISKTIKVYQNTLKKSN